MEDNKRRALDAALHAYIESLYESKALKADLLGKAKEKSFFRVPSAFIHLNERAMVFRSAGLVEVDDRLDVELFRTPELAALADALRERMPAIAWPLTIKITIDGLDLSSPYVSPKCTAIGYANIMTEILGLRLGRADEIFRQASGWVSSGMEGLDNLADALDPIAAILPSTNRPVMGWTEMHDLMEIDAIGSDLIYAKTEVEAILKQLLRDEGPAALHEMIAQRKFVRQNNIERTWFVATDVGYLDDDPMGQVARADDLLENFEKMLDYSDTLSLTPKP